MRFQLSFHKVLVIENSTDDRAQSYFPPLLNKLLCPGRTLSSHHRHLNPQKPSTLPQNTKYRKHPSPRVRTHCSADLTRAGAKTFAQFGPVTVFPLRFCRRLLPDRFTLMASTSPGEGPPFFLSAGSPAPGLKLQRENKAPLHPPKSTCFSASKAGLEAFIPSSVVSYLC